MKKKILTIGPVTKDKIITPHHEYNHIGGASYYQICTLHQLNTSTTAIISIGENDAKMIDEFPDKKQVKTITYPQTMEYTNIYKENMTRTQLATLPPNTITPQKIENTNINLKNYGYAILSPLCPYDIPPETIKYLKEHDIETILSAQGYLRSTDSHNNVISTTWKNKEEYLKYTDTLTLDNHEMKKAFNLESISDDEVYNIISENNLKTIIITKAEQGSDIYTNNTKIHIPAIKTDKNIDPTGLGDTYIASYISKKQETDSIYTAGLFAAITTKYKIETRGPINVNKKIIEKELEERLN